MFVQTYRKLICFLKKSYPQTYPVSVRRLKLTEDYDGFCQFKGTHFLISINRKLPEHEAIETLLHEYAHVIAWDKCKFDDHCNDWGVAYSRIYRAFLKNFLNNTDP
jgi:Zn-dependent peptidase ImmA (M78 family)